MKYINRITIFSVTFLLGLTSFAVAVQKVVPGAVIHLDAREQNRREIAWKNLGLAGGKMPANNEVPEFEEGKIRIPALGINEDAKWYTATRKSETFGGPPDLLPKMQLEDWMGVGDMGCRAGVEDEDALRPGHELHHFVPVEMVERDRNRR